MHITPAARSSAKAESEEVCQQGCCGVGIMRPQRRFLQARSQKTLSLRALAVTIASRQSDFPRDRLHILPILALAHAHLSCAYGVDIIHRILSITVVWRSFPAVEF